MKKEQKTEQKDDQTSKIADADGALDRLADRVESALALIRELRSERDGLREKLGGAEERLAKIDEDSEQMKDLLVEREAWADERAEIKSRIEKILGKLDQLDEA